MGIPDDADVLEFVMDMGAPADGPDLTEAEALALLEFMARRHFRSEFWITSRLWLCNGHGQVCHTNRVQPRKQRR